jgi:formylglycine-generating enzyme
MNTKMFIRLFALCAFILFFAGKDKKAKEEKLDLKRVEKSLAKVTDKLYACKYEATNLEYRIFLNELKANKQFEIYNQSKIDSLGWRGKLAYNEPMVRFYHTHPSYNDYPVVNITHEGAENFCKWLTEKYNVCPDRKFKKVLFRLPTESEWEYAAAGGENVDNAIYPWGIYIRGTDGNYMCNVLHIGDENIRYDTLIKKYVIININVGHYMGVAGMLNDVADKTAPVKSYSPNKFELYNVCGNVAEMINEKGISKGGSWRSAGGDAIIKNREYYKKSSSSLGFRYFMEVVER